MNYDFTALAEKSSAISINTDKDINELNTAFLLNYNIFPGNIMAYFTEWSYEGREMRVGDTIVQQVFLPPIKHFSQKIIFGVRINNVINEERQIGFSYETIKGHVEKGMSTFIIEKTIENKIVFKIHTFSKPGNKLTQLLGPVFSIPYQTFCTNQGLRNVKRQLESP